MGIGDSIQPLALYIFFYLYEEFQNVIFGDSLYSEFSCNLNWEYLLGYDLLIHRPKQKDQVFISATKCIYDFKFPVWLRDIIEYDPMINIKGKIGLLTEIRLSKILTVQSFVLPMTLQRSGIQLQFKRFCVQKTEDFILYWALIDLQNQRYENTQERYGNKHIGKLLPVSKPENANYGISCWAVDGSASSSGNVDDFQSLGRAVEEK